MDFKEILEGWVSIYAAIVNQQYKDLDKKIQLLSESEAKLTLSPLEQESIRELKVAVEYLDFKLDVQKPVDLKCLVDAGKEVYYCFSSESALNGRADDELGQCTAYLDGINVTVDPIPDRLMFKSDPEPDLKECLVTETYGSLFLFERGIVWTSEKRIIADSTTFTSGSKSKSDAESGRPVWILDKGIVHWLDNIEYYNLDTLVYAKEKSFMLCLHTKNQVISYYPLQKTDLSPVLKQLLAFYGNPMSPTATIQNILTQKVNVVRLMCVLALLEQNQPWIEQYFDLKAVILRLVSSQHSIYELERLFHSCKREPTVLKEGLSILQQQWHRAGDQSKMRILGVIDRLLDPILIMPGTEVYKDLNKWLGKLEESLNPFRHSDLLEIVVGMLERMRAMKGKLWPAKSEFVMWAEYETLSDEYRNFRTKGLWK